jgi:anti-sigma B factor antagonist
METPASALFSLTVCADDGGPVVVALAGDFDMSGVEEFHSCIDELIDTSNGAELIVDLTDVTFIDSSGIAAMLEARRLVTREHRQLRFENLTAPASRLIELTGLTDVFHDKAK